MRGDVAEAALRGCRQACATIVAMSDGAHVPEASLRSEKQALRGRILASRDDLPADALRQASLALVERIVALPSFLAATTVAMTLPFRREWDTTPLAARALALGKIVAIPRVDRVARTLVLHRVLDLGRDAAPGYLGLPEPRADTPIVAPATVDWILVPGVAFDAHGHRLGYGGGFFDRLLPELRQGVPRIAAALDVQIVDEVPAGPHDQRVDTVITPTRVLVR
jgi:5-formyltetrahydrofolate cyclo-ligase